MNDKDPLGSLFLNAVSQFADRVVIKAPRGHFTYSQLHQMVINFSLHLSNHGVKRGSTVALAIEKAPVLSTVAIISMTLLGARWIKYDPGLKNRKGFRVNLTLHDKEKVEDTKSRKRVGLAWLSTPENYRSSRSFDFPGYESADDTWFIAVSSGTTGDKKYMPISGKMFHERILRFTEYSPDGKLLEVNDLFPRASNVAALHFLQTLSLGGTYIMKSGYTNMAQHGLKLLIGSPSHLSKLLADVPPPESRVNEVRVVGGALYPDFLAELLKYFRTVRVSYGSTEAGPTTSKLITEHTQDRAVGPGYPSVQVQIVDEENKPLGPGTEGVVRIKTAGTIEGYFDNVDATGEAFREGWFYPGDRGHLSSSGDLYIAGRVKDQLNVGGLKINAAPIDELIQGAGQVVDGLCFVEINDQGRETLAGMVAIEENSDPDSVVENLLDLISREKDRYKFPKMFYVVAEVPRNDNGKIMRHAASDLVKELEPVSAPQN